VIQRVKKSAVPVETGQFRAMMDVAMAFPSGQLTIHLQGLQFQGLFHFRMLSLRHPVNHFGIFLSIFHLMCFYQKVR
jgi:hypothetical protein